MGDGKTNPFGSGGGASASSGRDPLGQPQTDANPLGGGKRQDGQAFGDRSQTGGAEVTPNPDSIPAGGKLPYSDAPKPIPSGGSPFKLKG